MSSLCLHVRIYIYITQQLILLLHLIRICVCCCVCVRSVMVDFSFVRWSCSDGKWNHSLFKGQLCLPAYFTRSYNESGCRVINNKVIVYVIMMSYSTPLYITSVLVDTTVRSVCPVGVSVSSLSVGSVILFGEITPPCGHYYLYLTPINISLYLCFMGSKFMSLKRKYQASHTLLVFKLWINNNKKCLDIQIFYYHKTIPYTYDYC